MLHIFAACFVVIGIEARGFIFGPPIALAIGAKFVPLRKPKKLPGTFICSNHQCLYMYIHTLTQDFFFPELFCVAMPLVLHYLRP